MGACCSTCEEDETQLLTKDYGATDAASSSGGDILDGRSPNVDVQNHKKQINNETDSSDKYHKLNKEVENLKDKLKSEDEKSKAVSDKYDKLQIDHKQLEKQIKEMSRKLNDKDVTIQDLSLRLSTEMSTKVSSDESTIENVAIMNRPTNVAAEYQQICSDAWLEAKKELDEIGDQEVDKIKLLAHIIEVADNQSKLEFEELTRKRDDFLSEIFRLDAERDTEKDDEDIKKPFDSSTSLKGITEVTNAIGDLLRNTSNTVNLEKIIKQVNGCINEKSSEPSLPVYLTLWSSSQDKQTMKQYIETVTRVAWKMAIQRPPMHFLHPGDKYDATDFEPYWNSDLVPNALIVEVYPALYHAKQKLANGKVICIDPLKNESQDKDG